jgi:STE24 endopeptidase
MEGKTMRFLIISIMLVITLFGFFLKYLTYSRRNAPLPENVKDVFDEETYKKNQIYKMDNLKFSIITGIIGMVISLSFLLFNFHHMLFEYISERTTNIYLTSFFILFIPVAISAFIGRLLGIYDTFVIEARYGFNKTTPITFIIDTIKILLIAAILLPGLLALFLLLYNQLGNWVFAVFFFVLLAFQLFIAFISPFLIRIIYKLTPLEDGELKEKIEDFAKKTGYRLKGIYTVNASKRSTKLNAFATGFGKTKTIGLFDTLIEKMTIDEVISVLAHEVGHAKKRHIIKRMPLGLLQFAIVLFAAYFIITMPAAAQAFGFADVNIAFGIYVMFILISPLMLVLQIPSNALSRKHEYEADAYEKELGDAAVSVSALKKLYREGFGNLTPHPFVVMLEHTHPPLSQRISALEKNLKNK